MPFLGWKWLSCSNSFFFFFFFEKAINKIMYMLALSLYKIKKNPYSRSTVTRKHLFWGQNAHLPDNNFGKTVNIIFMYFLGLSLCKFFKKNPQNRSRLMRIFHFLAKNGLFAQKTFFFRNPLLKNFFLSFMSIYIQNIKVWCQSINNMLTIKNWNLISSEHFGHILRTRFFPGM